MRPPNFVLEPPKRILCYSFTHLFFSRTFAEPSIVGSSLKVGNEKISNTKTQKPKV